MITAKPIAVVTMLALASAAVAQENTDEQRIAELIERLMTQQPSQQQKTLQALARMRGQARIVLTKLLGESRNLPSTSWPALVRAFADIAPYAKMDQMSILTPLFESMWPKVDEASADLRAAILNEVVRLGVRMSFGANLSDAPVGDLVAHLEHERAYERELAAEFLGHLGKGARSALPALRRALLAEQPRAMGLKAEALTEIHYGMDGIPTDLPQPEPITAYDEVLKGCIAETMEKIAPGDPAIAFAVAYRLLRDSDASRRMEAARLLSGFGNEAAQAVRYIVEALEKGGRPSFVRETITALGMIGPTAKDAIPTLERLMEHEDRQIAERAKAALRQVRGRRFPVQALGDRAPRYGITSRVVCPGSIRPATTCRGLCGFHGPLG